MSFRPTFAFYVVWNWLFNPQSQFNTDRYKSAAWNRGGEIVHGLAHCGECHTPKNLFFADKAGRPLQGETVDNWHAPNLTGSPSAGLGAWSIGDTEEHLRTGKSRFSRVVGRIRDVVRFSTSAWTQDDRHAVAVYLKSPPAAPEEKCARPDNETMRAGQAVYVARCATCHGDRSGKYAQLAHNMLLNAPAAATVLRVILEGSQSPPTPNTAREFSMPALPGLGDKEFADVASYIRHGCSWGSSSGAVARSDEKRVRTAVPGEH